MKNTLLVALFWFVGWSSFSQSRLITTASSGKNIQFVMHLPEPYEADQVYPVVIGPSDLEDLKGSFYWKNFKNNDQWILIDAPTFKGPDQVEMVKIIRDYLQDHYSIEGNKFHIVGFSANSAPTFKLVMAAPQLFHSVTGMPAGVSATEDDFMKLKGVKIQLLVGEDDGYWYRSSKSLNTKFSQLGLDVSLETFPDQGHFLTFLNGQPLMDRLNTLRPKLK